MSFIDSSVSGEARGGTLEFTGVTGTSAAINVQKGATLNVKNLKVSAAGTGFYPQGDAAAVNVENCDMTAVVYCIGTNAATVDNYDVQINLKNSTFTSASDDGDNCAILLNVAGTLNVDNCKIVGDRQGMIVRAGTATIKNSTLETTGKYKDGANKYHDSEWKSGNEVPAAALTVGNYYAGEASAYKADATVTLDNIVVVSKNSFPAIYTDGNTSHETSLTVAGDKTNVTGKVMKGQQKKTEKMKVSVTGGTYSNPESVKDYLDASCTMGEDGKVVALDATNSVAQVGGKYYKTFEAAVNAVNEGEKAVLLKDTTVEKRLTVNNDKKFTIDLGGKNLTLRDRFSIESAFVTVENGTITGDIMLTASGEDKAYNSFTLAENAKINGNYGIMVFQKEYGANNFGTTVNVNGEISGTASALWVLGNITTDYATAKNPVVVNVGSKAVMKNTSDNGTALQMAGACVVTVEDGAVITGNTAIEVRAGKLTVNGGTITGTGTPTVVKPNGNGSSTAGVGIAVAQHATKQPIEVVVNGGKISGYTGLLVTNPEKNDGASVVKATINGGTFEAISGGTNAVSKDDNAAVMGLTIAGGTFKQFENLKDYLEPGCALNASGTVVPADNSVASIGGKGYKTLAEALNAAAAGDTIKLLKDVTVEDPITLNKENVVFDGNGNTLKVTSTGQHGAIDVTADNVTIQNIKINSARNYGVQFYNVAGGKLSGAEITGGKYTSVYVNASGDITIENSVLNPTADKYYAAIEYGMGSGDALELPGKVTIDGVTGNNPIAIWTDKASTAAMIKKDNSYTTDNVADKINSNIVNKNSGSIEVNVEVEKDGKPVIDTTTKPGVGSSSSGGSSSSSYTVNVEDSKNGTVTASHKSASKNTNVTLTVKADKGYELDELTVTDKNGKELKLTDKGNGKYTFAMPASKVDVKATFAEIVEKPAYSDVSASAWYAKAVAYVTEKGMMEGSSGKFMPLDKLTRSQMAQVLFNLEGKKSVNYALTFGDMNGTEWYAEAVRWAASEQIVNGYDNGNFGPNDPLTREQLAAIMYRYTVHKGYVVTASGALTAYNDGADTSSWAKSAVEWAVGAGLLSGKDGNRLDPQGAATRAEVAQILMNFDQKF